MANLRTLTTADIVFTLAVAGLFDTPVQLQGFATDNVFDADPIVQGENIPGIDGRLSSGYVFHPVKMKIHLQADSESCDLFDTWVNSERSAKSRFPASGVVTVNATGKSYVMTRGFLGSAHVIPGAAKTLKAQEYEIEWESVQPSPIG